ncbi:hypothetical protein B0T26DRAFT_684480 [Lasiosphaeria miniovina]|uniref:Uncharacterized protein n=1 Tax=Lasiosphaeria miniovina TaxID=1954250 RepID=A0AA40BFT6_9PEZI|nr:uncharacterized protein B0T26DRAFT_684480 [Lasiosphaeria miniovina]KAK0733457.1 hypothetical protein B0T26DRAFT_684480 [Lasiosphaeria miniovina]
MLLVRLSPAKLVSVRRVVQWHRIARRLSTSTSSFGGLSVALNLLTASKEQVADAVTRSLRTPGGPAAAAVVLASGGLASWLQDEAFMSRLLAPLVGGSTSLSVLSAAVHGIPRRRRGPGPPFSSSEGLAVLHGSLDGLLPGLWNVSTAGIYQATGDASDQPSLEFHTAPLDDDARPLQVTVPLANTIFSNGRQHTMFASRWHMASGGAAQPQLADVVERMTQSILVPRAADAGAASAISTVAVPLVPVTEARRIAAGLGNILRQVEIGVTPMPASKELESVIPKLLDARSKQLGDQAAGPVGVWALIYPENFVADANFPRPLELSGAGQPHEWSRAQEVSDLMPRLLAAGCHVRKILSGGGGWGLKQGLLSLDPQTRHATPDQEDIESFIRSFHGDKSGGGIVTPGSFVQFLVEPAGSPPAGEVAQTESNDTGPLEIVVGTQDQVVESLAGSDHIEVGVNLFGAISSDGIYVVSRPAADQGSGPAITTKIDASNSYVVSSP